MKYPHSPYKNIFISELNNEIENLKNILVNEREMSHVHHLQGKIIGLKMAIKFSEDIEYKAAQNFYGPAKIFSDEN